jgi:Uma2 family endonuclease
MEGPPDLCVEVISPSSAGIDRRDKFKQYAQGGVAFYRIVGERHTVEGFELQGDRYQPIGGGKSDEIVRLAPFPDLPIPLGEIWHPA